MAAQRTSVPSSHLASASWQTHKRWRGVHIRGAVLAIAWGKSPRACTSCSCLHIRLATSVQARGCDALPRRRRRMRWTPREPPGMPRNFPIGPVHRVALWCGTRVPSTASCALLRCSAASANVGCLRRRTKRRELPNSPGHKFSHATAARRPSLGAPTAPATRAVPLGLQPPWRHGRPPAPPTSQPPARRALQCPTPPPPPSAYRRT